MRKSVKRLAASAAAVVMTAAATVTAYAQVAPQIEYNVQGQHNTAVKLNAEDDLYYLITIPETVTLTKDSTNNIYTGNDSVVPEEVRLKNNQYLNVTVSDSNPENEKYTLTLSGGTDTLNYTINNAINNYSFKIDNGATHDDAAELDFATAGLPAVAGQYEGNITFNISIETDEP